MITLNQTPGNDNEAIFLLKLSAEGNNLIGNSTFTNDTGWTVTGDWVIAGGVAAYTYDDDATGYLEYEIAAVTAVPYILEYTVTARNGTDFYVDFEGGGSYVSSQDIRLDITLGKHSIVFSGNNTGTKVRFTATSFQGTDSLEIDNVKIRMQDDPIYLSTRDIVLDPVTFDGEILAWNQLGDLTSFADVESGGGIGAVTSFNFSITRNTTNSRTSSFFNEFFPAYNGGMIIARDCQFGIVWNTGTPDYTNVTWLFKGRVISYDIQPRQIDMTVLQVTEFDAREIPYYSIQKDFDNDVSYFVDAPDENYGLTLPIVYGDFSIHEDDEELFKPRLFPIVCVDKYLLRYVCGTHKFDSELWATGGSSYMRQYLDGLDVNMVLTCANGSATNNDVIAYLTNFDTLDSVDNIILGTINIRPTIVGTKNEITDYKNIIDGDDTTTLDITAPTDLVLKVEGRGPIPGTLSRLLNAIVLKFNVTAATPGGANTIGSAYWNPEWNSGEGGYSDFGIFTYTSGVELKEWDLTREFSAREVADEPWRADELLGLEYKLAAGSGQTVTVRNLWLMIRYILISDPRVKSRTWGIKTYTLGNVQGQYATYERRTWLPAWKVNKESIEVIGNSLARGKGREFGKWVDSVAGVARDNGFNEGDLIENPVYIIESLLRDELFVERDLQLDQVDTTNFKCQNLLSMNDDYYNYAEFYNATSGGTPVKSDVTDYVGATNTVTIADADAAMADNDNFYLTNVQGDYKIDYASFDVIGNTTNGKRNGEGNNWKFARSINSKQAFQSIINELLFESHCVLFESADEDNGYSKIKIKALDKATVADFTTLASPIKAIEGGRIEQVRNSISGLDNVFSSFKLYYNYDYGKGDFTKSILVDKRGYSNPSGNSILTDEHKNLCEYVEKTYRISNVFTYSSNWIYDDVTAELFLDKKIKWFTEQRLKVRWTAPLYTSADVNAIAYELGDQSCINYTQGLPAGYEYQGSVAASHKFMIMGKQIITNPQGTPYIILDLIDMGI